MLGRGVVEIIPAGLMAPINISAITFIPGMEFTFGSFNFITGIDGRLHVPDPETIGLARSDQTRPATSFPCRIHLVLEADLFSPGISSVSVIQLTCFSV